MTYVLQLDRARRANAFLAKLRLRVGDHCEPSQSSSAHGSVVVCAACHKVVGVGNDLEGYTLLDDKAGWVLERRRKQFSAAMCGGLEEVCECCGRTATGCNERILWDYPMACSDECENKLLVDDRFEHCEPPFGYQRGGPHP